MKSRQNNNNNNKKSSANSKKQGSSKPRPRQRAMQSPMKQVSASSAYSTGQSSFLPNINSTATKCRIRHRELISSVVGSTNFTIQNSFPLNPGMPQTFPWLSTQGQGWEQYRFHKLCFRFYTRTGTTTPGSVLLTPDYDAADPAPPSELVASSYQNCVEDAPWKDIVCDLSSESMHPDGVRKFIRSTSLAQNLDIKTYDAGNLFVATIDGTAVSWGKLWVEYDVEFSTPQLITGGIFSSFAAATGIPTSTNLLGTAAVLNPYSNLELVDTLGEVITFTTPGNYLVLYSANGTSCTQTVVPLVGGGAIFIKFQGITGSATSSAAGTNYLFQTMLINTPVGGTLTFNNAITGGAAGELAIISMSPNFY